MYFLLFFVGGIVISTAEGLPLSTCLYETVDTALAAYLLDATAGSYDLQRLFVSYYNEELPKPLYLEKDAFSLLGDSAAAEASLDRYAAAVDALYETLAPKLREKDLWDLFESGGAAPLRCPGGHGTRRMPGGCSGPVGFWRGAVGPDCPAGTGHL